MTTTSKAQQTYDREAGSLVMRCAFCGYELRWHDRTLVHTDTLKTDCMEHEAQETR